MEFNLLQFNQLGQLFDSFVQYRDPDPISISASTLSAQSSSPSNTQLLHLSDEEARKFVEAQVRNLTRAMPHRSTPKDLQSRLMDIWKQVPSLARTHYATYLNALQTRDFELALTSLYRFFNYGQSQSADKFIQHYALLDLAYLYWTFNYTESAVKCVEEAVHSARLLHDHVCLSYAVSWLGKLKRVDDDTLGELEQSSKCRSLLDLSVETGLLRIRNRMESMYPMSAQEAKERLEMCAALSSAHQLKQSKGAVLASESALLDTHGTGPVLPSVLSHMQLGMFESEMDVQDVLVGYASLAHRQVDQGYYTTALNTMKHARRILGGGVFVHKRWVFVHAWIQFQRYLARDQRHEAQGQLDLMQASVQTEEDHVLWCLGRAEWLVQMVNGVEALECLESVKPSSSAQSIKMVLKMAWVLLKMHQPHEAILVLSAQKKKVYGEQYRLLMVEHDLLLAEARFQMRRFNDAYDVIQRRMPDILASMNLRHQCRAYHLLADLTVHQNKNSQKQLKKAQRWLELALTGYKQLESISDLMAVLKSQAYLAHETQDFRMRDCSVAEYQRMQRQRQSMHVPGSIADASETPIS